MNELSSTLSGPTAIDCPHCGEGMTHLIAYNQYFDEDDELCMHFVFACDAAHYFEMWLTRDEDGTLMLTEDVEA